MMRFKKWLQLGVASVLLASPAAFAAGGRTECDADCSDKAGTAMSQCTAKCPSRGRDMSCTIKCAESFKKQFDTCSKRCPKSKTPLPPVDVQQGDVEPQVIEVES